MFSITINVILSLFRIIEGYVRFDWKAFCLHKKLEGGDIDSRANSVSEGLLTDTVINTEGVKIKSENIESKIRSKTFKSKFNILSISGKGGVILIIEIK